MSDKSRSKQETMLLEERIEKIRKKNEEIKRRYLEVEADKQNAAKLNALVQITSPSEDWPIGGRSFSPPPSPNRGIGKPRRSEPYKLHQNNSSNGNSAKTYSSGEGDGPPPDPKYKFLADSERDSQKNNSDRRQYRPYRGRGGSRGIPQDRQYRVVLQKPRRESEQPHPEYEAWRAERIRIDNDRISRQKTAEGQWRREWDHEKITQEEDERLPARVSKGGGPRRNNNWSTNIDQHINQDYNAPKEHLGSHMCERGRRGHRSGTQKLGRDNMQGHRVIQPQQESSTSKLDHQLPTTLHSNVGKNGGNTPQHAERNVVSIGECIKISVPNNNSTPVVKRVKVNAPIVGGTGRVGPRQKIRVSYSSQSEDETPHSRTVEMCSTSVNALSDSAAPNLSVSTAFSKPPLPPSSGYRSEAHRPRRQRIKRAEFRGRGGRKDSDNAEESTDKNDSERGNESGGDDSWEDVTTTSGNESACEEMSPHNQVVPDTTSDEKLETNDRVNDVTNSQSCNVTQLEERESRDYVEHTADDVQSETGDELQNNLIDTVIKCNLSESITVNESTEKNVHNETETAVSGDLENESKCEENNVTHVSSEII